MSRRRVLYLAGLLPLLLVVLYATKVAVMLSHDGDGRGAFDATDFDDAAAEFAGNRSLNVLEPWVAAFDEGTAHHAAGDLDAAVADYTAALADVPAEEECTVRIDLALAQEALGDAALEMPDRDAALDAWRAGVDALEDGGCPEHSGRGADQTADAKAVDERLRHKIEDQQPAQQPDQPDQPDQQQPQDPEERDREKKLQHRNQAGEQERKEDEQRDSSDLSFDGQRW